MRIGLVPISAKPYHAGHHALVSRAAGDNDLVMLFVSTSDRKRKGELPVLGSDMLRIWKEYLEPIMPSNVDVYYGGTPVQKVYGTLQAAEEVLSDDTYVIYSDLVDTAQNYPVCNRLKYFPELYKTGKVVCAAEEDPSAFTRGVGTPDVSGTAMRNAISIGDFKTFSAGMPPGVDARAIFNILQSTDQSTNESLLRAYVRDFILSR